MKKFLDSVAPVLALSLVPLAIISANAAIPGFEAFSLFRIVLVILLGAAFLSFLTNSSQAIDFLRSLKAKRYLFLPFILLLYALVSLFWAVDKSEAVRYTALLATGVFHFYLLMFYFSNKEGISRLYKAVIIAFSLAILVGVMEVVVPGAFRMPGSKLLYAEERLQLAATSFFYNQNDFSAYIALTFPFLYWPLIADNKRSVVSMNLIFGLSLLAIIIFTFTGSKISLLALAIFAMGMLLYLFLKIRGPSTISVRQAIYGYVLIGFILLLLPFPNLGPNLRNVASKQWGGTSLDAQVAVSQRDAEIDILAARSSRQAGERVSGLGSLPERVQLMRNALNIGSKYGAWAYIAGVGAGNVGYYMAEYQNTQGLTAVHNWWLEIFADFGIFGALIVGLFVASLIKDTFLMAKTKDDLFAKISLLSLLILLLVALAPSSLKTMQIHWIIFGFAAANLAAKTFENTLVDETKAGLQYDGK